MSQYDFSTLNDKDFEELSRDLLSLNLQLKFQSFKVGKDLGIDLRYSSTGKANEIVVQVKHYYETGYKGLISSLKKENAKLKILNPTRYIISTSIKLLPQYKGEIVKICDPYILSQNDIYGNEDLNQLLQEYPNIETNYYKLWLSSTNVLKRVLKNGIKGRSEFQAEKIINNIKLYVKNESLTKALSILKKHKFLLISGQPGVGKTTLASMLTYSLLAKNFELIYIDKNILDAEEMFDTNPKSKQVFYFDDFLGANYLEILNAKSSDSGIVNFIERIQKSKNKYLILTTRTVILNSAKQIYEKISKADLDLARKELELVDYTEFDKAKILYNHLFFSNLKRKYLKEIIQNKNYWKIIKHDNYNPRLIEFLTKINKFKTSKFSKYLDFVMHNLDHPDEIWTHSYENQIQDVDRFFILILFSLDSNVEHSILEKAFNKKIDYEIKCNGIQKPHNAFNLCIKRLIESYVNRFSKDGISFNIEFANPSISDFLISYLLNSKSERKRLIESCLYIEQIQNLFISLILRLVGQNNFNIELLEILNFIINNNYDTTYSGIEFDKETQLSCKRIYVFSLFNLSDELIELTDTPIYEILIKIDFEKIKSYIHLQYIKEVMIRNKKNGLVDNFFKNNWDVVIESLLSCIVDWTDFEHILEIFETYNKNFSDYCKNLENKIIIQEVAELLADSESDILIENEKGMLKSYEDIEELKNDVIACRIEIFENFSLSDNSYDEYYFFSNIDETDFYQNSNDNSTEIMNRIIKENKVKSKKINLEKDIDDLFYMNF